jgi:hypothetical protein
MRFKRSECLETLFCARPSRISVFVTLCDMFHIQCRSHIYEYSETRMYMYRRMKSCERCRKRVMAGFRTETRLQFFLACMFINVGVYNSCYDCQRYQRFCMKSLSDLNPVKFDYDNHVTTCIATVGDTVDFILT